jgi:uncharacterized iron-regulated protein
MGLCADTTGAIARIGRWVALIIGLAVAGCTMEPAVLRIEGLDRPLASGKILDTRSAETITFDQLIDTLDSARVIYVGERHTSRAHHRIQLDVIRALSERGKPLSVGMEMFDHTYQHQLDRWSSGELQWEAFLKQVHWYANWKFDDTLYKDILVYIQKRNIPLVGLNIPFHLPAKISVGGLDSLSDRDRALLPDTIDVTNTEHRAFVKSIFTHHSIKGRDDFENFYTAQCAWEDGMAQAIADNLKNNTMVVIAGNGHIVRKFGIPNRAYARTKAPFLTIYLATPNEKVSPDDADFIWAADTESAKH